jgi:transcriptional regulator with XRE-family HTH domain
MLLIYLDPKSMELDGMSITGQQCAMARAALKWSLKDMHEKTKEAKHEISLATINRFEIGHNITTFNKLLLQRLFEAYGVSFTEDGPKIGVAINREWSAPSGLVFVLGIAADDPLHLPGIPSPDDYPKE